MIDLNQVGVGGSLYMEHETGGHIDRILVAILTRYLMICLLYRM